MDKEYTIYEDAMKQFQKQEQLDEIKGLRLPKTATVIKQDIMEILWKYY